MNKTDNKTIYPIYTLLFIIFTCVYFGWALFSDYTLIDDSDNLSQHYKAFVYYGQYLRNILKTIFVNHSFTIPQFDLNIGEGSDILQTLCYYCIGDPFALFSVLVHPKNAYLIFGFVNLLRLYVAGFAFIIMCHQFKKTGILPILAGVTCYIFTPFAMDNVASQVFFLNPFIFLPLLITGVNKIQNNESPILYILIIFFASLSNFYFFYMLTLLIAIYTIIKAVITYGKDLSKIFELGTKCFLYAFLAILMAAFLLLPVLYFFTHDARSTGHSLKLLYEIIDYAKMPFSFTSCYGNPGWGIHTIFAIIILFTPQKLITVKKDKRNLQILLLAAFTCIIFPFLSQILNGFSYPTERWMFAFYLLTAYIVVCEFNELQNINAQKALIFLALNAVYCIAIALVKNGSLTIHLFSLAIQSLLGLLLLSLIKLLNTKKTSISSKSKQLLIFFFVISSTYTMNMIYLKKNHTITIATALKSILDNDATKAKTLAQKQEFKDFFRYTQKGSQERHADNISPIVGVSTTQYYWSLSNPNISDFRKQVEIIDGNHVSFFGLDTRPILMDLENTLYFCRQEKQTLPPLYNFEKTEQENLYKNKDFLPFGYTYSNYIKRSDWVSKNPIEKEVLLSKAVVLEDEPKEVSPLVSFETNVKNVDYSLEFDTNAIENKKNSIIVKRENSAIKLHTNIGDNKIAFIRFNKLDFKKKRMPEWTTVFISTNTGYTRKFDILTPEHKYYIYQGVSNYLLNLGFFTNEAPLTEITISFSDTGEYLFDSIQLITEPTEPISQNIKQLAAETLHNIKIGTNTISGEISLSEPKILCLSTPYLAGWKAIVDGKPQELLHANIQYMGLELPAGRHNIEMKYQTPLLKYGFSISLFGLSIFIALIFIGKQKTPPNTERT